MRIFDETKTKELSESETDMWRGGLYHDTITDKNGKSENIMVYREYPKEEQERLAAQKLAEETQYKIDLLKAEIRKVKEDLEQYEWGIARNDYEEKKARAIEIVNELRVLEGKEPHIMRQAPKSEVL